MRMSLLYFYTPLFPNEDNVPRYEKYSRPALALGLSKKLDISRSFIAIFEINLEDTFTRCEKYSSKLDISRSFLRIFAIY